jgi:Putative Flp pilus-assembly TadE/G-like
MAKKISQRGSTIVFVVLVLPVLLAFAALAIDMGRAFVVKNELQNAADAAALAGASALTTKTPDAPNANYANPNWTYASTQATLAVQLNHTDSRNLADATVEVGYWNIHHQPEGMQATTITPGTFDKPAVRVTVKLAEGHNGGPLNLLFAPIFGEKFADVSATALALISPPEQVLPGALFPTAMAGCLFNYYWDAAAGKPKIDPATGKPYVFKIGSAYHYPPCASGEWTSFQVDANSVTAIRDLIANGNPGALSVGQSVWIQTGAKSALYADVAYPKDVLVAVVGSVDTHSFQPIIAFAPFHIINAVGGDDKYVEGYFIDDYKGSLTDIGDGSGIDYGAYTPPTLAQ